MAGHNDNSSNIYNQGLEKNAANYVPLSPLTFIARSAYIYPDRVSVIHGQRRFTWLETFNRAKRLASALEARGIKEGDTVAVMLNNTPQMYAERSATIPTERSISARCLPRRCAGMRMSHLSRRRRS